MSVRACVRVCVPVLTVLSMYVMTGLHVCVLQSASDGSDDEQYNAQMKQRVSDKLRQKKKVKEDKPAPGGAGDDAEFVSPQQRETNRKM